MKNKKGKKYWTAYRHKKYLRELEEKRELTRFHELYHSHDDNELSIRELHEHTCHHDGYEKCGGGRRVLRK